MCRARQIAELQTALTSNVQIEEAKNQEGCNGLLSNISAAICRKRPPLHAGASDRT